MPPCRLTMPVLVLTGRRVYSSNEEFVDVMRQEPLVTTFGDTTGGGSGNPDAAAAAAGRDVVLEAAVAHLKRP
ncbi:MAG: S41 family peptidase [Longimicrobiales bacterium]|nr:S41 family peptidase [Longimicrobiales bacterium]